MNHRAIFFLLGRLLLGITAALIPPALVAAFVSEVDLSAFIYTIIVSGTIGLSLERAFHDREPQLGRREAFVLVAAAWLTASIVGALPWIFFKGIHFSVDAWFEAASGFTTTGASILTNIEGEPAGLLLWRSLTHWLGGMGIIVLGIAILPKLAIGGMQLLGAEAPGPTQEKLTPRIAQTAKALWVIYATLTGAQALILFLLGISPLDAINHAFATMATGGFSTLNASVAGFNNPLVEWTIIAFMILAGANFALHFKWLRGNFGPIKRDTEFKYYLAILGFASLLIFVNLWSNEIGGSLEAQLRWAVFQAVAIITTTGFVTANYELWPGLSQGLIFLLFFMGGCAGSTGGSIKVVRHLIVLKKIKIELRRLIRPHAVLPVRFGTRAVSDEIATSVLTFVLLFFVLFGLGGVVLTGFGLDPVTAFSASASCLGNVGPAFGEVGPVENYSGLPVPAKLLLTAWMLIGRLELYTVLVLVFVGWRLRG